MRKAKVGDRVKVHFTGKLSDGTVVGSSRGEAPLEFTIGERKVMLGLEDVVRGMRSGETRSATIPPERAHGARRDDMLLAVDLDRFPGHVDPYEGQQLVMRRGDRPETIVTVVATTADSVLLDTNHPLAGEALMVEVELVEIGEVTSVVC